MSLARAHGIVDEVAQFVGLRHRLAALASELTTAGKKRLELARALSSRPRLLLLDEVLAGLNPSEVDRMCQVIRDVRSRGVTILMIEHVMRAIMSLSDRVIVLNLGRKMAEGAPSAVASNPEVIAVYLGEAPGVVSRGRSNG
jgi:branched-chain amino acid transport system ATP-binding protein